MRTILLALGLGLAMPLYAAPQGDSDPLRAKARVESYALKDSDPLRAKARVESYAPPQQLNLVYDLYRNGQKLGQVTDRLTRSGNRYTLVSETRATGALKWLWPGNIRLESSGEVSRQGLRPTQFQHARSDAPHKLASAKLDWKQRSITYQYKGETRSVSGLRDGAQDQLSQLYQFMFVASVPPDYALQVISGRDLNDYQYARSDGGALPTPLGTLTTQQYQRVTRQADEKAVTVWVAPARNNLPVQVRVIDDGVTLEQRLVQASIKEK